MAGKTLAFLTINVRICNFKAFEMIPNSYINKGAFALLSLEALSYFIHLTGGSVHSHML
jgi:hypothetical protein